MGMSGSSIGYSDLSLEVIRLVVMLSDQFPLCLQNIEDLLSMPISHAMRERFPQSTYRGDSTIRFRNVRIVF
jgi:hypothetical protein